MDHYNGDDHSWLQTFTGLKFWPLDPRSDQVNIEDIAHALSMVCRYGGHCREFYSVAQHSVLVSELITDSKLMLTALLHDAAEAYTADIVRPIKKHLKEFQIIEHRLEEVIAEKFGLVYPFPQCIKDADNILLVTERRDLMAKPAHPWSCPAEPLPFVIKPWPWEFAKERFLSRAKYLINNQGR